VHINCSIRDVVKELKYGVNAVMPDLWQCNSSIDNKEHEHSFLSLLHSVFDERGPLNQTAEQSVIQSVQVSRDQILILFLLWNIWNFLKTLLKN
jgi:hypothetical protein